MKYKVALHTKSGVVFGVYEAGDQAEAIRLARLEISSRVDVRHVSAEECGDDDEVADEPAPALPEPTPEPEPSGPAPTDPPPPPAPPAE